MSKSGAVLTSRPPVSYAYGEAAVKFGMLDVKYREPAVKVDDDVDDY
jgi:hypothetical protein